MELLERDDALRELDSALNDAVAGQGRVVLISGEAGIGKTWLVREFTRRTAKGVRVLWGACDALFTPRPLGPLHDIAPSMGQHVAELLDAQTDRAKLFAAVLDDVCHSSEPTLLVIEDVHWADDATLDLIKYLGRRIDQTRALLVLTYRDDELSAQHPLRTVIGDLPGTTIRLPLARLSEAAVAALALAANHPARAHELFAATNGNPFFVTEVLASQRDEVPITVRDAVMARAARLSLSGHATLEAAAVIGPRIELQLLSELTSAEAPMVEECISAGMLYAQGAVLAFRHELARQTILASISPQRKQSLHSLTVATLRAWPSSRRDLARLAHHAEGAGDREAVLEYAPAAARQAVSASAHREAAALYGLALRYADDVPAIERAHLLESYAYECYLTNQIGTAVQARLTALEIWGRLARTEKQGQNLRWLSRLSWFMGKKTDANSYAIQAIDMLEKLPPNSELAMAYSNRAQLHMLADEHSDAVQWCQRAIDMATQLGDQETLAHALNNVGTTLMNMGDSNGQTLLEHSLKISLANGFEEHAARAYTNLGCALVEVREYAQALPYLNDGIQYCFDCNLDSWLWYMTAWRARCRFEQGHWSEATDDAHQVLVRSHATPIALIPALATLARVRIRRGDPEALALLDEARDLAMPIGESQRILPVILAQAEAAWLRGDLEQCAREARVGVELCMPHTHPWKRAEPHYWLWRSGAINESQLDTATPFALQISGDWHAAAIAWAHIGCPYEQAMALADGDSVAQAEALDIFERLGARAAAEIVRQRLHIIPTRRLEKEKFDGLTEREREVAALIAQGKSNREIAATMVVGVKTIETYVTRILNKLGFGSRVQIATWAIEKGLNL